MRSMTIQPSIPAGAGYDWYSPCRLLEPCPSHNDSAEVPPGGAAMLRHQQPEDAFLQSRSCCVVMASPYAPLQYPLSVTPKQHHAIGPRRATRDNQETRVSFVRRFKRAYDCLNRERRPMEAIHDFDQLQLHFVDHVQWRYELIRPVVLIGSRTAGREQRKRTPTPIRCGQHAVFGK